PCLEWLRPRTYSCALLSPSFVPDAPFAVNYPLSLHDALPISLQGASRCRMRSLFRRRPKKKRPRPGGLLAMPGRWLSQAAPGARSEEHTSELQSRENLVCRLLLEKKNPRRETAPWPRHRRPGP